MRSRDRAFRSTIHLCMCYPWVRFRARFKVHSVIVPTCAINPVAFVSRILSSPSLSLFPSLFFFSHLASLFGFYSRSLCTATKTVNAKYCRWRRALGRCAAPPFHLIILKNDPWPTKAAITCTNDGEKSLVSRRRFRVGTIDDSRTMAFFSIFDEYRGNERGIESFHRRLGRVVSSLP